ncbi:hypothetical protein F5Y18DRAFT_431301 [Xylariaceae sp. FL1019]|nr:hypothetical protein F5Y18DRAFT_431301 [Xylariaceae sp. FL1019]
MSIDPRCTEWLVAFHMRVARPLARLYTGWALRTLRTARNGIAEWRTEQQVAAEAHNGTAGSTKVQNFVHVDSEDGLSRAEEIFGALYRYQTYQHLFDRNEATRRGTLLGHENNELFFCIFGPWESSGLYNPTGSVDFESEHDDFMDGILSRGLAIAMYLLAIKDHELVTEMERHITGFHSQDSTVDEALGIGAQFDRRDESTYACNTRDEAEQRRDLIRFVGDSVLSRAAPFAWVALWSGKYSNLYDEYVPSAAKHWSYVMWDQRRWADIGVDESLIVAHRDTSPERLESIEYLNDCRPVVRWNAKRSLVLLPDS